MKPKIFASEVNVSSFDNVGNKPFTKGAKFFGVNNPNYRHGGMMGLKCHHCNIELKTYNKNKKYCSKICYNKCKILINSIKPKKKRVRPSMAKIKYPKSLIYLKNCKGCSCAIVSKYYLRKYCKGCQKKIRCAATKKTGLTQRHNILNTCLICKNTFRVCKSTQKKKYCSFGCRCIAYKGAGNPHYINGNTKESAKIRASSEYKKWRTSVFERDKYTCVLCFKVGGVIHADHIKQFAFYPELRLDINNGRTLCFDCHKKTDTYLKGRKKC